MGILHSNYYHRSTESCWCSLMIDEKTPNHYKMKIEPIDYIVKNNLGWHEGNAIKYISRWRGKGGVRDLEKAIHYLEMLKRDTLLEEADNKSNDMDSFEPDAISVKELAKLHNTATVGMVAYSELVNKFYICTRAKIGGENPRWREVIWNKQTLTWDYAY